MRGSRILLWAIAGTTLATIFAPFVAVQFPGMWLRGDLLVLCGILVLIDLVTALGCAVALEAGRAPRYMRSGIIAGAIALSGWLILITVQPNWPAALTWSKFLIWPTCWTVLMMVIGLLLLPDSHARWWTIMRRATLWLLSIMAAHICLAFLGYPGDSNAWPSRHLYEEWVLRIGAIIAILTGGSLIVTAVTAWLARFMGESHREALRMPYWLRCPRCGEEQNAVTGRHECRGCGLRVRVEAA